MVRYYVLIGIVILIMFFLASYGKIFESGDQAAVTGYRLLSEKQYAEAAEQLEKALRKGLSEQKPEFVYTCLGNALNELGEYGKAIDFHKKALAIDPEFHNAWVNLGIVYRLTGKFDKAEKCYARALELKPEYAELHASIGALYIHQGNYHRALTHLEKAVRLDKNLAVAWANLSLACATVGEFERAESSLKKAVVLGYENAPSLKKRIDDLQALSNRFSLPRTAPAALENDETVPEQKTA